VWAADRSTMLSKSTAVSVQAPAVEVQRRLIEVQRRHHGPDYVLLYDDDS
jgi:hypothetical protein